MQALEIASAKLTGNPDPSGWAQVHQFSPQEEDKLLARGQLFAVISTTRHEEGVDSVVAGRELLSRLHEEYFGEITTPAFAALKEAVEKVIEEFTVSWGKVEIAAAVYLNGVVYSVVGGGAQAVLFRDGMLAKILESSEEKAISASGYPKPGDIFLLATSNFFTTLSTGVIRVALEGQDPGGAVEALAPYIHSREKTGSVGAVVLGFSQSTQASFVPEIKREEKAEETQAVSAPLESEQEISGPHGPAFRAKSVLSGLAEKALSLLSAGLGKVLPEKRIYIRGEAQEFEGGIQGRKVAISVGIILLVLLLVSIAFGVRQKRLKDSRLKYETRLTQAQHEFEESLKLASISQERARELFLSSRSLVSQIEDEGFQDEEIEKLKGDLTQNEGRVLGEYKDEPALFVDLSILTSGFVGDELVASDEKVYVLNRGGKRVVSVATDTKKSEIVAGPDEISEAQSLAAYSGRVFVLTSSGISETGEGEVIEKGWEGGVLMYMYGGNMYVIDKSAKTIWRYAGSETGFGSAQKWNTNPIEANLEDAVAVTIDGAIWMGFGSGDVHKYSLGNRIAFDISGVNPELNFLNSVYTNEGLSYIYILDRQEGRVVVIDKEGKYKAQYIHDKIKQATDLAVSEKNKKIILLTGDKLLSLEAKHL